MTFLRNPTPPRLPDPPGEFSVVETPRALTALLHVLRLYFAQLDAVFQALLGRNGGQWLEFPTGSFYGDVDQTFVAATVTPVVVPLTLSSEAFSRPSTSKIAADLAGTYMVQVMVQVRNLDAAAQTLSIWLRKNALDIPTSRFDVTAAAGATLPVSTSYTIDLLPTDTFEIMAFSASANVRLYAPPVAGAVPRGAAARIKITFVSSDSSAMLTAGLRREKIINDPPP